MKIRIILIAAMLAVTGLTQAQVSEDAFKKAVDFINCKTVELSIKNDSNVYKQYIINCPCGDGTTNTKVREFLISSGTYDKTIALMSEIESLKSAFKKDMEYNYAFEFLSNNIFYDDIKYKKIFSFAEKRKNEKDFTEYKNDLEKALSIMLKKQKNTYDTEPIPDSSLNNVSSNIENTISSLEEKSKFEDKGWFTKHLTIFVIITLITTSILLFFKILSIFENDSSYPKDIPREIKNYIAREISTAGLNKSNLNQGESNLAIVNLEDKIKKLDSELKHLKSKVEIFKTPFEVVESRNDKQIWKEPKQQEVKLEIFFLSTPNSDGSFNDSSVSPTYKEGASIYRFTKIENNRAKFQIDEREASVKLALTYPDKSIDPVCDAVNAFNPKAKRITTVEAGEAELLNDKWIINKTQKAKISYES
jgi:hypothetical protein